MEAEALLAHRGNGESTLPRADNELRLVIDTVPVLAWCHGIDGSSEFPASDGSVLGTFAIYWREPSNPKLEHHQLIRIVSHLAAVAIESKRAAEALRESEKFPRGQTAILNQALDE
jgi:hypothetical protein